MRDFIVEVCGAFTSIVSAKKTETMCMPPPRTPPAMLRVVAAGKCYKQLQSFTCLGGPVIEPPDMSVENARWIRPCWVRIRRYLRELCHQPKITLSLTIRIRVRKPKPSFTDAGRGPLVTSTTLNSAPYTTGSCFVSLGHNVRHQTIG